MIKPKGGWTLNHFSGVDTYLGRLVLQPRIHREGFDDLSAEEVQTLDENLQRITKALKDYAKGNSSPDIIQRVYIVYFWETPFAKRPPKERYHMHIHILPRSKNMVGTQDPTKVAAWHIPKLPCNYLFPSKYGTLDKKCKRIRENDLIKLMSCLSSLSEH